MRIAHIVPPEWTGLYPLGDYRMALAHWVLQYPEYAKQLRKPLPVLGGAAIYILMDNGVFENSQAQIYQINEAAKLVQADEVILPDVMGEPRATLELSWEALGKLDTKRVMFVAQGRTHEEWSDCLNAWMTKWSTSGWSSDYRLALGIPSLRRPQSRKPQIGSRLDLIEEAAQYNMPMHLLGMASLEEFLTRELPTAVTYGVRGIDTSTAFALAANHNPLTPTSPKVNLKDPKEYETLRTKERRLVYLNLAVLSELINTGATTPGIPARIIRKVASHWLRYWAEGFAPLEDAMSACGMPEGRYALSRRGKLELNVRPFSEYDVLKKNEEELEWKRSTRSPG